MINVKINIYNYKIKKYNYTYKFYHLIDFAPKT